MNFNYSYYVPCLRWKQGEYQAVSELLESKKRLFRPLIEIPELGWDFKEKKEKKTANDLLTDFAFKKIYKNWGSFPCFVDLNLIPSKERMKSGVHPIYFIFDEFRRLGCQAIPVTGLLKDSEYQREIKAAFAKDKNGICLRIAIEQVVKGTFKTDLNLLLSNLEVQSTNCDFILDLGSPNNFVPLNGFSMIIQKLIEKMPHLNNWRTFTLLGTSFPETIGSIKKEE
jgi:hypothetical protein